MRQYESLREAHAALDPRVLELRALLDGEFSWDEARTGILELRKALQLHFALEESRGYFAEVLARAPELASAIAKLEADHSRMRADLTRLLAEALVGREKEDMRTSVHDFLASLAAHELRENEMAQRVLMGDAPGGD